MIAVQISYHHWLVLGDRTIDDVDSLSSGNPYRTEDDIRGPRIDICRVAVRPCLLRCRSGPHVFHQFNPDESKMHNVALWPGAGLPFESRPFVPLHRHTGANDERLNSGRF